MAPVAAILHTNLQRRLPDSLGGKVDRRWIQILEYSKRGRPHFLAIGSTHAEELRKSHPTLMKLTARALCDGKLVKAEVALGSSYTSVDQGQSMVREIGAAEFLRNVTKGARYPDLPGPHRKFYSIRIRPELGDSGRDGGNGGDDDEAEGAKGKRRGKTNKNRRRAGYLLALCPKSSACDKAGNVIQGSTLNSDVVWMTLMPVANSKVLSLVLDNRADILNYTWDPLHTFPLRITNPSAARKQLQKYCSEKETPDMISAIVSAIGSAKKRPAAYKRVAKKKVLLIRSESAPAPQSTSHALCAPPSSTQAPVAAAVPCCSSSEKAAALLRLRRILQTSSTEFRSARLLQCLQQPRFERFLSDTAAHSLSQLGEDQCSSCDIVCHLMIHSGGGATGISNVYSEKYNRHKFDFEEPFFSVFLLRTRGLKAAVLVDGVLQPAGGDLRVCVVKYDRQDDKKVTRSGFFNMSNYVEMGEFAWDDDAGGLSLDLLRQFKGLKVEKTVVGIAVFRGRTIVENVRFVMSVSDGGITVDPRAEARESASPHNILFIRPWKYRAFLDNTCSRREIVERKYPSAAAVLHYAARTHKRKRGAEEVKEEEEGEEEEEEEVKEEEEEGEEEEEEEEEELDTSEEDTEEDCDESSQCDVSSMTTEDDVMQSTPLGNLVALPPPMRVFDFDATPKRRKLDDTAGGEDAWFSRPLPFDNVGALASSSYFFGMDFGSASRHDGADLAAATDSCALCESALEPLSGSVNGDDAMVVDEDIDMFACHDQAREFGEDPACADPVPLSVLLEEQDALGSCSAEGLANEDDAELGGFLNDRVAAIAAQSGVQRALHLHAMAFVRAMDCAARIVVELADSDARTM